MMDETKNTVAIFNKYANQYQDKYMDLDLYDDTFDVFCSTIAKENAKILDIACGPGNITKYLLKKRPDFSILGVDLSTNMINLAKINNPTAHFQVMDCRDINTLDTKYNGILCGFCLPYLSKEETIQLIRDANKLLNSDGVFYISTMEDDYSKSGYKGPSSGGSDKMYTYYHQEDYLTIALKESGFKITTIQRKDFPVQGGTCTTDLIIIAKKVTSSLL